MNWKIVFVLLAVCLLLAGCAKGGQRGAVNETASGGTGAGGGAGTQTGAANASGDVGNLFQVDTDRPIEGGGYDVPAAGE